MAELPFFHPALLGVAVATGVVWSAIAPLRFAGLRFALAAAVVAAAVAGLAGWVPWTGHLQITLYALFMGVGFILAWLIVTRRTDRVGIPRDHVRVQFAIAAIAGILGARIWYVIEYRHEFPNPLQDPGAWLTLAADLDRGGAVWFGGLLLATVAMAVHTRRAGIPMLRWADCAAPGVLAGLAAGRVGCFCNGCCYGGPCQLPWSVMHHGVAVHPTQLYESAACAAMTLIVMRIAPGHGAAAGWSLIGYAVWRWVNETMRGDYDDRLGQGFSLSPLHMTSAQWLAFPLAALGVWLVLRARGRQAA